MSYLPLIFMFLYWRPCLVDTYFPWVCGDEHIKQMFARQGEEDYQNFLVSRAKELVKGMLMFCYIPTDSTLSQLSKD